METLSCVISVGSIAVGISAVSVAIFGTLRARSRYPYALLIALYGAFTVEVFLGLVLRLFLSVGNAPSAASIISAHAIDTSLSVFVVAVGTLYVHGFFSVAARRLRDLVVVCVAVAAALFYARAGGIIFQPGRVTVLLRPEAYLGIVLYLSLFSYLLLVGITSKKRGYSVRESVLIWSALGFGVVCFYNCLDETLRSLGSPHFRVAYSASDFNFPAIAHILVGIVMIYYFGFYILAERQPIDEETSGRILRQYGISQRERDVIALMERGLSNREIAKQLFVSPATIKSHLHNIYEKTGAKSRQRLSHMLRTGNGLKRPRFNSPA